MVSTMGPVYTFTTTAAETFRFILRLTSGDSGFIGTIGIAFAALIIDCFFHIFHLEADTD